MYKFLLLFFILLYNTSQAQLNFSFNNNQAADSILASYCRPNEPGMAIGIIQNGQVLYKKYCGLADLSNNLSITDSTLFNIASVSKQFTALITILAVEEGKISLQDDITLYLPELKKLPFKITVKQLANHTHGLPNYSDLIAMMGFDLSNPIDNKQAVKTILSIEQANFKPESQYQYGNSGYILLAEILKRVYNKPFSLLVKEKIFEPLHMSQSRVIDDPDIIVYNKALAYAKNGEAYVESANRQMESGSSNIYTSLNDMIKWATNFQNPIVGNQNQIDLLSERTVSITRGSDLSYGLGLFTETYKGLKTVFHGGGTGGYRAYIIHVPSHNFSIITLGNQAGFDGLLIVQDLLDLYLKDYIIAPSPIKITNTENELIEYAGTYQVNPGQYWTIKTNDNQLYFSGVEEPLQKIGNRKFKFLLPTSYLTFYPHSMDFRIADFNYTYQKVNFNPIELQREALEKYIGIYKNNEFNTFYEILLVENGLIAKHITNGEIDLHPLNTNSFYAEYPLGQLDFKVNSKDSVTEFLLSGQNYKNLRFYKVNECQN